MLEIFREIEAGGQEWIVTGNGKPVLRILPITKDATHGRGHGDAPQLPSGHTRPRDKEFLRLSRLVTAFACMLVSWSFD